LAGEQPASSPARTSAEVSEARAVMGNLFGRSRGGIVYNGEWTGA
jgi:hypothetical protein